LRRDRCVVERAVLARAAVVALPLRPVARALAAVFFPRVAALFLRRGLRAVADPERLDAPALARVLDEAALRPPPEVPDVFRRPEV